jgi:hypothetical protein
MYVICHQYINVNPVAMGSRRIIQLGEVTTIVLLTQKAGLSIVAALDHMLRHPQRRG